MERLRVARSCDCDADGRVRVELYRREHVCFVARLDGRGEVVLEPGKDANRHYHATSEVERVTCLMCGARVH